MMEEPICPSCCRNFESWHIDPLSISNLHTRRKQTVYIEEGRLQKKTLGLSRIGSFSPTNVSTFLSSFKP